MKSIETTATVDHEGKLFIELLSDLTPGSHHAVVVIDETTSSWQSEAIGSKADSQIAKTESEEKSAWKVLRENAGSVEMPEDWAKEHNHYLHGTPKKALQG